MRSFVSSLSTLAAIGLLAFAFTIPAPSMQRADLLPPDISMDPAELRAELLKTSPGSPRALKLQKKIRKLEAWQEGNPEAGFPNIYSEILYERKIPANATEPAYERGYRLRELANSSRLSRGQAPLVWQSRGPGNVAGRARGIVIDHSDPTGETWLIGTAGGGVWKTTDAGTTWASLTDDLPILPMTAIAMAPSDYKVIYAGTGEAFNNIDTMNGNGVYRTTDGGISWVGLSSTIDDPSFNNISRIVVDPNDADHVVLSTVTGRFKLSLTNTSSIFESTDGGTSWNETYIVPVSGGAGRIQQIVANPENFNTLYASVNSNGILKSVDGGSNWTFSNVGFASSYGRIELAVSPIDTNLIYASVEGSTSLLYVSDDGAATWTRLDEGSGTAHSWLGAQGWYDNTIVCDVNDRDRVYVGGIYLWRIDRTGPTTREISFINANPSHVDNHGLHVVQPAAGGWFLLNTNDGGVGRTASSYNSGWTKPTNGMITTQFYGVTKRPGRDQYLGGMQDNSTWSSPENPGPNDPWTFHIGGDGYEAVWHDHDATRMMGGYQFNGIQRSLDGGLTWTGAVDVIGGGQIDNGGGSAPFITKIANSPAAPDWVYAVGTSGVWHSSNFGGGWELATMNDFASWQGTSSFTDVRVSRADPTVVWAGRGIDASRRLQVSTDQGLTFNQTADYAPSVMGTISGISTHPTDPNTAFALFSFSGLPKVLKTTDLGLSWVDISGHSGGGSINGFPDVAVYDLMVFSDDPNQIWVGSEIGLIESVDGGATWAMANNGLPNVGIWQIQERDDEIVIATHGRGIWTVERPSLVAGKVLAPVVESISINLIGDLDMDYLARSSYDDVEILVDGLVVQTDGTTAQGAINNFQGNLGAPGTHLVQVRAISGATTVYGMERSFVVENFFAPVGTYVNDFDGISKNANQAPGSDFTGSEFSIGLESGFSNQALHSPHFYANGQNYITTLRYPIRVASSNATVSFDEIAIVEPGNPGSVFGDNDFWDYAIVEATTDGQVWIPLGPGYDARADAAWESAYNGSNAGVEANYRNRSYDLLDSFNYLDVVYLRWRLFTDSAVTSWGWAIDNIEIQTPYAVANEGLPSAVALDQNHPNPFNPSTTISFSLPARSEAKIEIFDLRGRLIRTLASGLRDAGEHKIQWHGDDDSGRGIASGVYVYRLEAGDQRVERRMTLLK